MPRVLRFTLQAPLAAWGSGGAGRRPTEDAPTWSAIVGLLGAALGWSRTDERLVRLAGEYTLATRTERQAERMWDYHTVQTPHEPSLKGRRARTRADELAAVNPKGVPNTNITRREYLVDARWTGVVWPLVAEPEPDPDALAAALERPVYALYAGRRGCPLSALPEPRVVQVETLGELLQPDGRLCWDERIPAGVLVAHQVRERRDVLLSPTRRTFGLRREALL